MSKVGKKRQNFDSRLLSMKVEVGVASFELTKIELVVLGCILPANFTKMDKRILFRAIVDEKGLKYLAKKLTKKLIKIVNNFFLPLKLKSTTLFLKNLTKFSNIDKVLGKNSRKCE